MSATMETKVDEERDVLWLPLAAVGTEKGKRFVLVRNGEGVIKQEVQGRVYGDDVFIIDAGLEAGDKVLVRRHRNL